MSRLPLVGSDNNTWGNILNDYLLVSHNADGTEKSGVFNGGTITDLLVISTDPNDFSITPLILRAADGADYLDAYFTSGENAVELYSTGTGGHTELFLYSDAPGGGQTGAYGATRIGLWDTNGSQLFGVSAAAGVTISPSDPAVNSLTINPSATARDGSDLLIGNNIYAGYYQDNSSINPVPYLGVGNFLYDDLGGASIGFNVSDFSIYPSGGFHYSLVFDPYTNGNFNYNWGAFEILKDGGVDIAGLNASFSQTGYTNPVLRVLSQDVAPEIITRTGWTSTQRVLLYVGNSGTFQVGVDGDENTIGFFGSTPSSQQSSSSVSSLWTSLKNYGLLTSGSTAPTVLDNTTKLDQLAAPTDVTTLNSSTSTHGLLPKLDNTSTHFLDGTGAWSTPAAGSTDGWTAAGETWTFAATDSPTFTFTVAADVTTKYSAGMRLRLTQSSTVKYFIVTAVSTFSGGNTTITIYGGTNYTLANSAISVNSFSTVKAPFGFPLDPLKWTVATSDTSAQSQASPTTSTWYNPGTLNIVIPIGVWEVSWQATLYADKANGAGSGPFVVGTLSTTTNSESDTDFTAHASFFEGGDSAQMVTRLSVNRVKHLALAAKTTYSLLAEKTDAVTYNSIGFRGDLSKTIIRAVCAYL